MYIATVLASGPCQFFRGDMERKLTRSSNAGRKQSLSIEEGARKREPYFTLNYVTDMN